MSSSQAGDSIGYLRGAASVFPLESKFRKASALRLVEVAMSQPDPRWKEAALPELYQALTIDPTSADLLSDMRQIEKALGREPTHAAMFDKLAETSPIMRKVR